jgi:high-affinity nickel permease
VFGLDDKIASYSNGTTLLIVLGVSILLGLRHASDPDHLAAVTTLIAAKREHVARRAARLGFTWGLGHASSLFVFGLPVVLYRAYLPKPVQSAAETTVGAMIVVLALSLIVRWRRGAFDHRRPHEHARARTAWQAYLIGLVHGIGGTAGVGILLLASIRNHGLAVAALGLFAGCTAISMTILSTGFGLTLERGFARRSFTRLAPILGLASLAFGIWYSLGAQGVVAYVF